MKTTVKMMIEGRKLAHIFLTDHSFTQTCLPKQKFKMADFLQDGRQISADFQDLHENHRKNDDREKQIGTHVPKGLLFQKSMLAKTKIQDGGFYPRWPPDNTLFSNLHETQ